ncbi:hypothetical protein BB8028_0007g00020 [Beauveria bassiana]|uniref:Rhodopsin domain-containing protein n=1 Tax=Beauveria bassiana TaxID=176275 RepID=A0A2S7YKW5_BEABA|nr:hypothetical protein BB8028_0007g00020 [Beauveria bassiana]
MVSACPLRCARRKISSHIWRSTMQAGPSTRSASASSKLPCLSATCAYCKAPAIKHIAGLSGAPLLLSQLATLAVPCRSLLFACQPIEKSWKPGRPGTCLPVDASFTVYSILTIVSDVIVAVLVSATETRLCWVVWGVIEFHVGMIMSSLPFLAPVCRRVAKEHCSKQSRHDGSSRGRYGAPGGASGQTTLAHAEAAVGESNGAHNRHSTVMVTREVIFESRCTIHATFPTFAVVIYGT